MMNRIARQDVARTSLVAGGILLVAATASAGSGGGPELAVDWIVDGTAYSGSLVGTDLGGGIYSYAATTSDTGFSIDWEMTVNDNGASGGFQLLASTIGVTNLLATDSDFSLSILLPANFGDGIALYGGSVGGTLTGDSDGGLLAGLADGSSLWSASVDGTTIAELIEDPFLIDTAPFESAAIPAAAFGEPIPSLEGFSPSASMGVDLDFILGGGDTVAVTSTFVGRIPTPATLAVFGLAGIGRRRRRA